MYQEACHIRPAAEDFRRGKIIYNLSILLIYFKKVGGKEMPTEMPGAPECHIIGKRFHYGEPPGIHSPTSEPKGGSNRGDTLYGRRRSLFLMDLF
jgi:hypothetical protein